MKILLTSFEPFSVYTENSSWEVASQVATRGVEGVDIALEQLPVSFTRAAVALRELVARHQPDILVMLGQSAASDCVRLERVALNLMDSKNGDSDGYTPNEEVINSAAPLALMTTLPIKQLRSAIESQGIAVKISNSCGLYVCNRLYYEALLICQEQKALQAIFVHLPLYEGQSNPNNKTTMPLSTMVDAIVTLINELYDQSRKI